MTTSTLQGSQTSLIRLRASFDLEDQLVLAGVTQALTDFSALMYLCYSFAELDERNRMMQAPAYVVWRDAEIGDGAANALNTTRVERLSFNSPLEIVINISPHLGYITSAAFALGSATWALRFFVATQKARRDLAVMDLQVELLRLVRARARANGLSIDLDQVAESAVNAAVNMSDLSVSEPIELPERDQGL